MKAILENLEGTHRLMASLLYDSGLRLTECLRSRLKDIDFEYQQIAVRDDKGAKDRVTRASSSTLEPLLIKIFAVKPFILF